MTVSKANVSDLTDSELKQLQYMKKYFSDDRVDNYLVELGASKYIKDNLELVPDSSAAHHPYGVNRGYSVGHRTYKRKDNLPITKEDIDNLNARPIGQISYVVTKPGDDVARVKFECDSGD